MARLTCLRSTRRVVGWTGITCTLILKYAAALSNAAWADIGITLGTVQPQNPSEDIANNEHFWLSDSFDCFGPIPIGLDCHNNGFRASGSHGTRPVRVVVQPEALCNNLGLHLADGGKYIRVKRIRNSVTFVSSHNDVFKVSATV